MRESETFYSLIIVDDEEKIRNGLSRFGNWEAVGFYVSAVYEDGQEALEHLQNEGADAVLTDIRMAAMSGLELAEQIAENDLDTHVVIMSGYRDFDYARRALKFDAVDYLLKPIEMSALMETFERLHDRIKEDKKMRKLESLIPDIEALLKDRLAADTPQIDATLWELMLNNSTAEGELPAPDDRKEEKAEYTRKIIRKVQRFVEANYQRDISLTEVAETVYLNPVYFCRLFKELTGLNFISYLTSHRIERAKELLGSRRYKVGEVGRLVGYGNTKYFTRVFKKYCGVTPTEFLHQELEEN